MMPVMQRRVNRTFLNCSLSTFNFIVVQQIDLEILIPQGSRTLEHFEFHRCDETQLLNLDSGGN